MPVALSAEPDHQPLRPAVAAGQTSRKMRPTVVLLATSLLIVVTLLAHYRVPITLDQAVYNVVGNELLHGQRLYVDIWDHKPPLVHVLYAAFAMFFGLSPLTILVPAIICSLITLLGVYRATRLAGFESDAGCWAAIYWTAVSLFPGLQLPTNTEALINACVVWILVIFLRFASDRMPWRYALLAGILLAAACLFKQIAIFPFLCAVPVYLLAGQRGWLSLAGRLSRVLLMLFCVAAAWLCVMGAFWAQGHFKDFWDAVMVYNRAYSGSLVANVLSARKHDWAILLLMMVMMPPLLVIAMARMSAWRGPIAPFQMLLGFAVGTAVAVAAPGKWYAHYFQLWSPLVAISAGCAGGLLALLSGTPRRWLPHGLLVLPLVPLLVLGAEEYAYILRRPPRWSALREAYALAPRLPKLLKPGQTFFAYDGGAWFYMLTRQRPPASMLYNWPILEGPLADRLSAKTVSDLERTQPALVILEHKTLQRIMATPVDRRQMVERYIAEHYAVMPGSRPREHYSVLTRQGAHGSAAATSPAADGADGP